MTGDQSGGRSAGDRTRRSRRGVLAGAAGALAVVAAETATRGTPAQAANGDPVLQGTDNGPTTSRTMVFTAKNEQFASLCDLGSHGKGSVGVFGHGFNAGVYGESDGIGVQGASFNNMGVSGVGGGANGIGVAGKGSGNGAGVQAEGAGTGPGVYGLGGPNGNDLNDAGAGVRGTGGGGGPGVSGQGGPDKGVGVHGTGGGQYATGVQGDGGASGIGVAGTGGPGNGNVGVCGTGNLDNGIGVWGIGQGAGAGVLGTGFHGPAVHGRADFADAIGMLAENTAGGVALKATGPASFSRSGVLTVPAGKSTVTKTGVALTSASLVLATLQQDRAGVWVRSAVPDVAASSFTIHLSKAVSSSTKVAWFVLN
jgi:hypothetical protein